MKRWKEEHRNFIDELADGMEQIFCAILLCSAIVTTAPIEGPPNSLVPGTETSGARLPGLVQPQLPSLVGGNLGGTGYTAPSGGGGVTSTIIVNDTTVNFGHGGRHLEGTGLNVDLVNQALANEVSSRNLSPGQFYKGQIVVDGITI